MPTYKKKYEGLKKNDQDYLSNLPRRSGKREPFLDLKEKQQKLLLLNIGI